MGLEPLPSPDELESELDEASETSEAEASLAESPETDEPPADTGAASESTDTAESTPEPDPAGATGDDEKDSEDGSNSPGCNVPASRNVPTGLGMLLLLGAPFGLVALPRLRRRWPFS